MAGKINVVVPAVHLNGTGAADLMEQILGARLAIHAAVEAMSQAAPNARDYYVQEAGSCERALVAHQDRVQRLLSVNVELGEIAEGITDQITARSR